MVDRAFFLLRNLILQILFHQDEDEEDLFNMEESVGAGRFHRNMPQVARDSLDGGLLVRLLTAIT